MNRKRSDKKKSSFFGDHLEIKPAFMQKPKSLAEVMAEAFSQQPLESPATDEPSSTVALISTTDQNPTPSDQTTVELSATVALSSAVAAATAAAEPATIETETPIRLQEEVARLRGVINDRWQALPEQLPTPEYWQGYALAWHWLEDELLPHLEKDLKLTLRRCYRKAFGDPAAVGKFFAGQTLLAKEVGLSKRRIQDIMEIFNILGWVCKVGHYNRGNRKGTDYEMRLPTQALNIFLNRIKP
ncbi:MAG: hypothetical protein AB1489_38435 [Acidobacteriota bacterium]